MHKIKYLFLIFFLFHAGCASLGDGSRQTENSAPILKTTGTLSDDVGIILMSAGRVQEREFQFQRPFLSYGIYAINETGYEIEALFLAEAYPFYNQLGNNKYGFVHIRELSPGPYLIRVFKGGSVGSGTYDLENEILYKFVIRPNVVNYLGEFLLTEKSISKGAIQLSNQLQRDLNALDKLLPELKTLEIISTEVE